MGAEGVEATDRCAIDQTSRDVVKLLKCQCVSLGLDQTIVLTLTRWLTP